MRCGHVTGHREGLRRRSGTAFGAGQKRDDPVVELDNPAYCAPSAEASFVASRPRLLNYCLLLLTLNRL